MASVHFLLLLLVICLSTSVADGLRFRAATKVRELLQRLAAAVLDCSVGDQVSYSVKSVNGSGAAPSSFASKMLALKPGSPLTLYHIKINSVDTPSSGLERTKAEGASTGQQGVRDGDNTPESIGLDPEGPEPEKPTGTKTDEDVLTKT
ncbi:hypothetical protein FOZ61_010102 [Perkinsus olseni]|uniref:Uncharacterized protein n=1 Tax=Perkinsus olseni TaxID=32597 RepID=A0A7J6M3P0_PEROL|nr:hypothetical protein FOL46_006159 [Perkinsus olseni]KAF4666162.1 hypothetical protein FOZ61_010102 [Perkinsus olseni]